MEYKCVELETIDGLKYFIDNPKAGQVVDCDRLKISGWAFDATTTKPTLVIDTGSHLHRLEVRQPRADVSRHLKERLGIEVNDDNHGFSITIPHHDKIKVGFDYGDGPVWVRSITSRKTHSFIEYPSLEELTQSAEGACGGVYFHNAEDWSKVIILFNGALTNAKLEAEKAPFQRWSWAKRFKHPVFCVVDPLTVGKDRIVLGWYLGNSGQNSLPQTLQPVIDQVRKISSQAKIVGFGSSGGGFAAIGATLLGCMDQAIAINPQTDALRFEVRSAVEAFQKKRLNTPCQSNLIDYDHSGMRSQASIIYVQNVYDEHHFNDHYSPFRVSVEKRLRRAAFKFIEYHDKKAGHIPPDLDGLCSIIGNEMTSLLKT